jgi:uncharacterized membrane-anchored protein YhcB (DUF1043 family)
MDFLALYGEAGMIGVVGAMFVYLVVSLSNKSAKQQETLKSDERMDRKFDDLNRHIRDLDSQISRVEGSLSRINGKH